MKKYTVVFFRKAEKDIDDIFAYVEEVNSKFEAKKVTRKIVEKALRLDIFPERTEPFGKSKNMSLRSIMSGKYRIIYSVNRKGKKVCILRIISVGRKTEDVV